jgi:2-oxoisovalerate dehydrogenase E1 component beta subunit
VIFFEHKLLYRLPRVRAEVPEGDHVVPIGRAAIRREGRDLTLISYGAMVYACLDAAEALDAEGVRAEVIDLRTLLPLDRETIVASVRRTGKALVVHEDTRTGGLAGEITAILNEEAFEHLDGPILRVTAPDTPVPFAPALEDAFLPNAAKVTEAARRLAAW